jgi:hypothetical protein
MEKDEREKEMDRGLREDRKSDGHLPAAQPHHASDRATCSWHGLPQAKQNVEYHVCPLTPVARIAQSSAVLCLPFPAVFHFNPSTVSNSVAQGLARYFCSETWVFGSRSH